MNHLKVLIFTSFLFISSSFAWVELDFDAKRIPEKMRIESIEDQYAYQFVTDICYSKNLSRVSEIFLDNQSQTRSMISGVEIQQFKSRVDLRGLSPKLNLILQSRGYFMALNDCYGNDQFQKDKLTVILLAADLSGDLTGTAQGILTWLGPSVAVRALSKFFPKLQKLVPIVDKIVIAGSLGIIGYSLYTKYRNMKKVEELNIQNADEIKNDYNSIIYLINKESQINPNSEKLNELIKIKDEILRQGLLLGLEFK